MKLYLERSMPVNNSSVKTLNILLEKFFCKYNQNKEKLALFDWFICGEFGSVDKVTTEEILNRLLSEENINFANSVRDQETDHLFDTLFHQVDKCILFSEFEYKLPKSPATDNRDNNNVARENIEINSDLNNVIQSNFENKLSEYKEQFNNNETQYTRYLQLIETVMAYLDVLFKSKFLNSDQIKETRLFSLMKTALEDLFSCLTSILKGNEKIEIKIKVLQDIKELMVSDYAIFTSVVIRSAVNEDFFHCINRILTAENVPEEDIIYEGDETEMNTTSLKYHCLYVLSAYCRVRANYRDELLELVLDPKLYNFTSVWDVKCAYKTIEILNGGVEEPPLGKNHVG